MSQAPVAPGRARDCVRVRTTVPGGPWFVELTLPQRLPVALGPYANPAIARAMARQLEGFLEALLGQDVVP